jgi:hypothetical protein
MMLVMWSWARMWKQPLQSDEGFIACCEGLLFSLPEAPRPLPACITISNHRK